MFRKKGKFVKPETPKEYNIINNEFRQENEAKCHMEERERRSLSEVVYKNRKFNPLLSKYYHEDEENMNVEGQLKKDQLKIQKKLNNLPISYKTREPLNMNTDGKSKMLSDAILYRSTDASK